MELSIERRAGVQGAMEQLWKELNNHLDRCLSAAEDAPKEKMVLLVDSIMDSKAKKLEERENGILSKEKELEARESEVDAMERVVEERQNVLDAKQKMLEEKSLELDSKDRVLAKREKKMQSELEVIMRMEYELIVREKKLADVEELDCVNATKMERIERKRSWSAIPVPFGFRDADPPVEMGESSCHKRRASGTVRSIRQPMMRCQDRLGFYLTIMQTHEDRSYMTVPSCFLATYDLSEKTHAILLTDEGSFRLEVKHYHDPRLDTCRHVTFRRGWRDFYVKNRLRVGLRCLFRVKEHVVNGDASVLSMEVSVLDS